MDGVDHRDTLSRRSALKNPVTSETADVPPFVLVQIIFFCAGYLAKGASASGTPTGAATGHALSSSYHVTWATVESV